MLVKLDISFTFDGLILSSTNVDMITFAIEVSSFACYNRHVTERSSLTEYATLMFTCKMFRNGRREHSR
jgi:hypothetical protein